MTCEDFKRDLHLHYTCGLEPSKLDELERHGRDCAGCDRLMTLAQELTCKDFTELLNDYVEGNLPPARRAVYDRHLSICPDCTAFLQSYRATMSMSGLAMKQAMRELFDDIPDDLVGAILAAAAEERKND